jgi:hypothetical protein
MKPLGYAVTLVAAGPNESIPRGVPLAQAHMRSLETSTVRAWLEDKRRDAVFAVAGESRPADKPSLLIGVAPDEFERLTEITH